MGEDQGAPEIEVRAGELDSSIVRPRTSVFANAIAGCLDKK
jgi:hypothetical protein